MAGVTRLELAASGVTGRRSNQLSYTPGMRPLLNVRAASESSKARPQRRNCFDSASPWRWYDEPMAAP